MYVSAIVCADLGVICYDECWDLQRNLAARRANDEIQDTLLLVEHPPVITLGSNFHPENLLLTPAEYERRGIHVSKTDRGGDVTYHGPGQLVIYPVFSVKQRGADLHKWLRDLEETMIITLQSFGLCGSRFPPHTGAWISGRKVASIGIKVSRWVSLHGIALNCNNDLSPFDLIVPCGLTGYSVTSLSKELGRDVTTHETKPHVIAAFAMVFNATLEHVTMKQAVG